MEDIEIVPSGQFKLPIPGTYTGKYYYVSDYTKKLLKSRLSKEEYQRISVMGIRECVDKLNMDYRVTESTAIVVRDIPDNFDAIKVYIKSVLEKYDLSMMSAFKSNTKMLVFIEKAKELVDDLITKDNLQAILDTVVIKDHKPTFDIKSIVPLGLWVHNGVEIDGEIKLLPFNLIGPLVKFTVNYVSEKLQEIYPYPYEWKLPKGKLMSDYIKIWHYEYKLVPTKFKRSNRRNSI